MSDEFKEPRLSCEHFTISTPEEQAQKDREYWRSRSIEERLEYLNLLIWLNYGDKAETGFQRVLEITEQKPR
jgi:hypothetical protein